jgi:hypothetical protein
MSFKTYFNTPTELNVYILYLSYPHADLLFLLYFTSLYRFLFFPTSRNCFWVLAPTELKKLYNYDFMVLSYLTSYDTTFCVPHL